MCIICNCVGDNDPHRGADAAESFLRNFHRSSEAMKLAAESMLEVSQVAVQADDRARYDTIHKRMVRLMRDWNRLEQEREQTT